MKGLTVADLRRALEGLPDTADVVIIKKYDEADTAFSEVFKVEFDDGKSDPNFQIHGPTLFITPGREFDY